MLNIKAIDKIRKKIEYRNLNALLVSSTPNIRYLSGFTGSSGLLCIISDKSTPVLLTDSRYITQAENECTGVDILQHGKDIAGIMRGLLAENKIKRLGFEGRHVSFNTFTDWNKKLTPVKLISLGDIVEELRLIKTLEEVEFIKKSILITHDSFMGIIPEIKPGVAERDIQMEVEFMMKKLGSEGPAFETIVASGINAAMPHAKTTDKKVVKGEFIKIDMGVRYGGYCSDMTRVLILGKPSRFQKELYDTVLLAQVTAINSLKIGMKAKELDSVARSIISKAGYGQYFGHGLGHGLGLEVHEAPKISQDEERILKGGMVFTIEPGVYNISWGGIRIEDMVYLRKSGGVEVLTSSTPKDLFIL